MDTDSGVNQLLWITLIVSFLIIYTICYYCCCKCTGTTTQLPQQRRAKKIKVSPSYDYGFPHDSIQFRDVTQQFGYYSGNKGCDTNGGDECARNGKGGGYSCSDNVGGGHDGGVCDSGGGGDGGGGAVGDKGGGCDSGGGDGKAMVTGAAATKHFDNV